MILRLVAFLLLFTSAMWSCELAILYPEYQCDTSGDHAVYYSFPEYRSYGSYASRPIQLDYIITEEEYSEAVHSSYIRNNCLLGGLGVYVDSECDCVKAIASELQQRMDESPHRFTDYDKCLAILMFVRSAVDYRYDIDQYHRADYIAYPVETLYTGKGDCEDVAILFTSIAIAMGLDAVLVERPSHAVAGVRLTGNEGYSVDGYTLFECTGYTYMGSSPQDRDDKWSVVQPMERSWLGKLNEEWRGALHIIGV